MNLLQKLIIRFLPSKMKRMINASQLAERGEYEAAIQIFEEEIGVVQTDRDDVALLRDKVKQWLFLNGRDDESLMFVAQYASSYGLIRLYGPSLTVLEGALGLEASDYKNEKALAAKLDPFWFLLDDGTRFMLWMGLQGVLSIIGRASEALDIFRYDLGILHLSPKDEGYKEEVQNRIEKKISTLQPDIMAAYLTFIFPLFEEMKLEKEGLALFENLLRLTELDYEQPTLLYKKLNKWVNGLQNPLTGKFALLGLASSLYQANETIKALALMEAYPGIQKDDYADVERLSQKWKALRDSLPTDTAATYYRILISMLETARRNPVQEVKALVQADSELRDADFEVADAEVYGRIGKKLHRRIALFQEDTKGAYIFSLGEVMDKVGLHREAAMVTEWFMEQHDNFRNIPKEGDVAIVHIIAILSNWFRFFYQDTDQRVLDYCRQTVQYLRAGFGSQGIRLEDRKDFIRYIGLLKTAVLNTGFFHLGLQPSQEAEAALALEVLLWDIELSQRVLAERFVLEERSLLPADPTIQPGQWAFSEPIPAAYPDISTGLSKGRPMPASLTDETDLWPDQEQAPEHIGELVGFENDTLTKMLRQTVNEAVNVKMVAESIGADTLILRLAFQDDGRLIWLAFLSDGKQLSFIGKHTGLETDRESIRRLVNNHESEIKKYWWDIKIQRGRTDDFLTTHTKIYVKDLSALLHLDALAPFLHESLHVVIQADGLLNSVPFSYVSVHNNPLFLQIASVSQTLSLLFQVLQQSVRSLTHDMPSERKIAVGSSFKKKDNEVSNRAAARQLHANHALLAQQHKLACFALGDQPLCTKEAVAGLVQQHRNIALLTLFGHGDATCSGIQLKNSLWKGEGCDLSEVELVLMVSCSIGRIHRFDNNLDVEGFCIQLAVNKAFSVIACRWEIDSWEACLFANEIAKQYLAVSCSVANSKDLLPFSKAKALNEARKVFYGEVGDRALNTLAAFEFYGLG